MVYPSGLGSSALPSEGAVSSTGSMFADCGSSSEASVLPHAVSASRDASVSGASFFIVPLVSCALLDNDLMNFWSAESDTSCYLSDRHAVLMDGGDLFIS